MGMRPASTAPPRGGDRPGPSYSPARLRAAVPSPWTPPEEELRLGLGFYASTTGGVGGRIKEEPESFRVREISLYPLPDPAGPFAVLKVRSRNWEQHELSQRIAQRLGLGPSAIAWAGTKDRRAIAERLASYRGPLPPAELGIPGVELLEAYPARDGLVLGHHFGNAFEIRLSEATEGAERIPAIVGELRAFGGVPNLFGPQRFGEVRPVTHRVGESLVRGDPAEAVERYLAEPAGGVDARGDDARRAYAAHHDPVRALREFPPEFRFERQILDHLARGQTPARALRALSRELRTLFVHAYQSLLFNRILTERIVEGLPIGAPVAGDVVLRVARDGTVPGRMPVPVSPDNLAEVRDAVARGRAAVAAPLVGFSTPPGVGRPGAIVDRLLREDGIDRAAFRTPATPDLASAGTYRAMCLSLPPITWEREEVDRSGPEASGAGDAWWFRFALPKGAYATVLLREFRKAGARPAEGPGRNDAPARSNRAY